MVGASASSAASARFELRALANLDSAPARQILNTLQARYPSLVHGEPKTLSLRPGQGVYLAIGPNALQAALDADLRAPIVALFTSHQTFQHAAAGATAAQRSRLTAIYAEASPEAELELIAALYQRRVSIGVFISPVTAELEPLLTRAARRLQLDLVIQRLAPGANIVSELSRLATATALLALPDSNVFTAESLRTILESTYRRSQPVIGFSPALVTAGTLGTAYASVDDVVSHLDVLLDAIDAGRTPEPQFPMFWRVAINDTVARSLNVVITDEVRALGHKAKQR